MTGLAGTLPELLAAHIRLTLAALAAGVLLAMPAGILVSRARALEAAVLAVAGVIQTVPALALLAAMVPLLSALGLPGIGTLPAFLGLVLYSLLPIIRNTVTGLNGVDPAAVEAAHALGMTSGQRLLRVELPLALPVIVAGLRTATVWTVGMATLSTPVGAPSLGNLIFGGLQTRNTAAILTGCAAAAVLALSLDGLVLLASRGLAARRRGLTAAAAAGLLAIAGWASAPLGSTDQARPIFVGGKTFTEQYVLAEILASRIRESTGRPARSVLSLGSSVAFDALQRGEIDVYVEYTGTLWATVMKRPGAGVSRQALVDEVRRWLRDETGIVLVASLGFENAYCFALPRRTAESLGVRSLEDLSRHAPRLSIGSDYEFFDRQEWRSVQDAYGMAFREQRVMDPSLLYQAVAAGQVDAITAYSTDGRIDALDLVVLEDERGAIPPYDAVVLASPRLAREAPDVLSALSRLEGAIGVRTMRRLNALVDQEGLPPIGAAQRFLGAARPRS